MCLKISVQCGAVRLSVPILMPLWIPVQLFFLFHSHSILRVEDSLNFHFRCFLYLVKLCSMNIIQPEHSLRRPAGRPAGRSATKVLTKLLDSSSGTLLVPVTATSDATGADSDSQETERLNVPVELDYGTSCRAFPWSNTSATPNTRTPLNARVIARTAMNRKLPVGVPSVSSELVP